MKYFQLTGLTFLVSSSLYADLASGISSDAWMRWFGNYHYIFLHFPIALIIMACVAELLLLWRKNPGYAFIVNFLLISAAILAIPTVLSGLSLEESGAVTEKTQPLLEWHEFFGFVTFSLTVITVIIRNFLGWYFLYLCSLIVLLISVIITAHLGGIMAFEDFNLLPPLLTQSK